MEQDKRSSLGKTKIMSGCSHILLSSIHLFNAEDR